jgi:hypothetical protein
MSGASLKSDSSFFYRNGLSLFAFACFALFLAAQTLTGWSEYKHELSEYGRELPSLSSYLVSGHFIETTFENWESEFLQMFVYVLATVWLRQLGSSESKPLDKEVEVDKDPVFSAMAPAPVKCGGWVLKVYKNSLSLAFLGLFLLSFALHAYGSYKGDIQEKVLKHQKIETFSAYMGSSKFWFESFQNWQSEFLAIGCIVVLSIYLRQQGSPESKPVAMPHHQNPD